MQRRVIEIISALQNIKDQITVLLVFEILALYVEGLTSAYDNCQSWKPWFCSMIHHLVKLVSDEAGGEKTVRHKLCRLMKVQAFSQTSRFVRNSPPDKPYTANIFFPYQDKQGWNQWNGQSLKSSMKEDSQKEIDAKCSPMCSVLSTCQTM